MSIMNIDVEPPDPLPGPACEECGGRTRLAGIEPHPRLTFSDLRTYECLECEATMTVVSPVPAHPLERRS